MSDPEEQKIVVGFRLKRRNQSFLKDLANYVGVTETEVIDFLLDAARLDIMNVARKLKENNVEKWG